jgi:hypothetical protein
LKITNESYRNEKRAYIVSSWFDDEGENGEGEGGENFLRRILGDRKLT